MSARNGETLELILYQESSETALKMASVALCELENGGPSLTSARDKISTALGLRRLYDDDMRLYRPLVEKALWAKGVNAVSTGTMSWPRLCDRFLAEVVDDDDVEALLRGTSWSAPRFGVVVVPTPGHLMDRQPSTPPPKQSPAYNLSPASTVSEIVPAATTVPQYGQVQSRRHAASSSRQLLERATNRWQETRVREEEDDMLEDVDKRSVLSSSLVESGHGLVRRLRAHHDQDESRMCYVEALRRARHDVEKLRGAQQAATLVAERDERRTKRAWRRWTRAGEQIRQRRNNRVRGMKALALAAVRLERRDAWRALHTMKATAATKRAARRGSAVSSLEGVSRRRQARAMVRAFGALRSAVVDAVRRRSFALQWALRLHKGMLTAALTIWCKATALDRQRRATGVKLLRRLAWSSTYAAWHLWLCRLDEQRELAARRKMFAVAARALVRYLRHDVAAAFSQWQDARTSFAALNRISAARCLVTSRRRNARLLSVCIRDWRQEVARRARHIAEKQYFSAVVVRATRRKVRAAWNTWLEEDKRRARIIYYCLTLRRGPLSSSLKRAALAQWRRALAMQANQKKVTTFLRSVLRGIDASGSTMLKRALSKLRTNALCAASLHKSRLAVVAFGAWNVAARMRVCLVSQAWAKFRAFISIKCAQAAAARHAITRLVRCTRYGAWHKWRDATKRAKAEARSVFVLRRTIVRMLHSRVFAAWSAFRSAAARTDVFRYLHLTAKRIVIVMIKAKIAWAWRNWIKTMKTLGARDVRNQRALAVVARIRRHELSRALHSWSARTIDLVHRNVAMRRIIGRLGRSLIYQGFSAWRILYVRILETRELLASCVFRLANLALCSAWLRWLENLAGTRKARAVLKRAVSRMLKFELTCALSRWRWVTHALEHQDAVLSKLRRVLSFFIASKHIATAWRHWRHVSVLSQVDAVRESYDVAQQVSALKLLSCQCAHAGRARVTSAWVAWRQVVREKRAKGSAGQRLILRMRKVSLSAAFYNWKLAAGRAASKLACVAKLRRHAMYRENGSLSRGLRKWLAVAAQHGQERASIGKCLRAMAFRQLNAALRCWRSSTLRKRTAATTVERALRRIQTAKLSWALDAWYEVAVEHIALLHKTVKRMLRAALASAMASLRLAVRSDTLLKTRRQHLRHIVVKNFAQGKATAWRRWVANSAWARYTSRVARTILGRWLYRATLSVWKTFKGAVEAARLRRAMLRRITSHAQIVLLASAIDTWRWTIAIKDEDGALMHTLLGQWRRCALWRGLARWRFVAEACVQERLLRRTVSRLVRRLLASGLRKWTSISRAQQTEEYARALQRVRQSGLIKLVVLKCGECTTMRVAEAWRAWHFFTMQVAASERIAKTRKIRVLLSILRRRQQLSGFRVLVRFVGMHRTLSRLTMCIRKRQLLAWWRSWTLVVNRTNAVSRRVSTLVRRMQASKVCSAWRRWCQSHRRALCMEREMFMIRAVISRKIRVSKARAWRCWAVDFIHSTRRFNVEAARKEERRFDLMRLVNIRLAHCAGIMVLGALSTWRDWTLWAKFRSRSLRRIAIRLEQKQSHFNCGRVFMTLRNAVQAARVSELMRQLAEERTHVAPAFKLLTACASAFSSGHIRSQSRAWHKWCIVSRDSRLLAERERRGKRAAISTLLDAAAKFCSRHAFTRWEAVALRSSCRELASQRFAEIAKRVTVLRPLGEAFSIWRAVSLTLARANELKLAAEFAARPFQLRHAACTGALSVVIAAGDRRRNHKASQAAFSVWYRDLAHDKGARLLSVTLSTAYDALMAAAWDTWTGANERRAEFEYRIWKSLERRVVRNAWIHWWTQVEVIRELQSLQWVFGHGHSLTQLAQARCSSFSEDPRLPRCMSRAEPHMGKFLHVALC